MRTPLFTFRMLALAAAAPWLSCASAPRGPMDFEVVVPEKIEVLHARLQQDTNDPVAHYNMAMGYWGEKLYDRADSELRNAVALDPEFALAHLALALVQMPNGEHWQVLRRHGGDTALAAEVRFREQQYTRAFMIDPFLDLRPLGMFRGGYESSYENLTHLLQLLATRFRQPRDSMPVLLLWEHSLAAARSNHLADAVADVQLLARRSRVRDNYDSVSSAPLVTNQYLYMLAALLQRGGDRPDAIRLYQEVLNNDLGNYEAHVQLARIYEQQTDWGEALAERRAAIAANPENHVLEMQLGVTEYRAGAMADAEGTLREARDDAPRDARVYYWLGTVQQARSEAADARTSFGMFLQLVAPRDTAQIAEVRRRLATLH